MRRLVWTDASRPDGLAILGGLLVAGASLTWYLTQNAVASDFDQIWHAAELLYRGHDPYTVIGVDYPFFYPATAAVVGIPFTLLPIRHATLLFIGLSSFLLAYGVLAYRRELWPLFLSAPFIHAIQLGQWGAILFAAFLFPPLAWLFAVKPNLGVVFLGATSRLKTWRVGLYGGLLLTAVSFAMMPDWMHHWWATVSSASHFESPVLNYYGPVLLLAGLRWRRWEARLLLLMAIVPQTPHLYAFLPLFLIPSDRTEVILLGIFSHVAALVQSEFVLAGGLDMRMVHGLAMDVHVLLFYLPCLTMVLVRPNEGELPAWWRWLSRWCTADASGP